MAVINEILVGRFNRALQKLFGIKGGPPSRQLASEIMPVIPFSWGPSQRVYENWQLFGNNFTIAGNAGFPSHARLRNPKTSNMIAEIFKIGSASLVGVNLLMFIGAVAADLPTVSPAGGRFDARGLPNAQLIQSTDNTVNSQFGFNVVRTPGTTNINFIDLIVSDEQVIPLAPGDAIQLETSAVNTQLTGFWWWRERPLEETELQNQ